MPIINGVSYDELAEYQSTCAAEGTMSLTMYVVLAGADQVEFEKGMLGYSEIINGAISRKIPFAHPRKYWLWAQQVEFVQGGEHSTNGPDGINEFAWIKLAVTFTALDYTVCGDGNSTKDGVESELARYVSRKKKYATSNRPIPKQLLEYVSTLTPVAEPGAMPQPAGDLIYGWHQVPCLPGANSHPELPPALDAAIQSLLGKTNDALFDGRYGIGTLCLAAPEVTFSRMSNGEWAGMVQYTFNSRGFVAPAGDVSDVPGWDFLIRPDGNYHRVRRRGDAAANLKSILLKGNFNLLFKIAGV